MIPRSGCLQRKELRRHDGRGRHRYGPEWPENRPNELDHTQFGTSVVSSSLVPIAPTNVATRRWHRRLGLRVSWSLNSTTVSTGGHNREHVDVRRESLGGRRSHEVDPPRRWLLRPRSRCGAPQPSGVVFDSHRSLKGRAVTIRNGDPDTIGLSDAQVGRHGDPFDDLSPAPVDWPRSDGELSRGGKTAGGMDRQAGTALVLSREGTHLPVQWLRLARWGTVLRTIATATSPVIARHRQAR